MKGLWAICSAWRREAIGDRRQEWSLSADGLLARLWRVDAQATYEGISAFWERHDIHYFIDFESIGEALDITARSQAQFRQPRRPGPNAAGNGQRLCGQRRPTKDNDQRVAGLKLTRPGCFFSLGSVC